MLVDNNSKNFSRSLKLSIELSYIQLFSLPTNEIYQIFNIIIENMNRITSQQSYHVIQNGENKKEKNEDLQEIWLGYNKKKAYKNKREASWQDIQQRQKQVADKNKLQTINKKLTSTRKIKTDIQE